MVAKSLAFNPARGPYCMDDPQEKLTYFWTVSSIWRSIPSSHGCIKCCYFHDLWYCANPVYRGQTPDFLAKSQTILEFFWTFSRNLREKVGKTGLLTVSVVTFLKLSIFLLTGILTLENQVLN